MPVFWRSAAALICAALAAPAAAQDGAPNFLALGVGLAPDHIGSDNYTPIPLIVGRYQSDVVDVDLRGLSFDLDFAGPRTDRTILGGLKLTYRPGRDDVDDVVVDRLQDVDDAVELGVFAGYRFANVLNDRDSLTLKFDLSFDVSDSHNGMLASPSVAYGFSVSDDLRLSFDLGAAYAGREFAETFFSVSAADAAASGLAQFDAESGFFSIGVGATAVYDVTERFGVLGRASYGRILGDAADSPIVDERGTADQFVVGIGASYRF